MPSGPPLFWTREGRRWVQNKTARKEKRGTQRVCESAPLIQPDMEGKGQCRADLLGKILDRDNLNRAYKRVKANERGGRWNDH